MPCSRGADPSYRMQPDNASDMKGNEHKVVSAAKADDKTTPSKTACLENLTHYTDNIHEHLT